MKVVVVGGGRMGLPLACVFARNGATVTVCDVNEPLTLEIAAGRCRYEEPGLEELLAQVHQKRLLTASTDTAGACRHGDVVVVIVPAHLTPTREIDFSILQAASAEVGKGLRAGAMVSYETTVSVGGVRRNLIPVLESASGMQAGRDFSVCFSPERVKANLVLARLPVTPKVVGGLDDLSREKARNFYGAYLGAPVHDVGSLEAAELTKLIDMLYRDVNIALVNELAAFSETAGIDFHLVRRAANENGESNLLEPGIGVGGHCTPIYPYFMTKESRRFGIIQELAEAAREINDKQPARNIERLEQAWKPLAGRHVHLLGLGFRPGVKVETFSPAYKLREELAARGAYVTIEDPYYTEDEIGRCGFQPGRIDSGQVEAVVLNTAHPEFLLPDFASWRRHGVEAVLDGRNSWDRDKAEQAGLLFLGVGKPASAAAAVVHRPAETRPKPAIQETAG